ncbi:MAG: RNA 2',3'-cyclic phosphodiesterase [Hellea sp.]|nr:RNA 2',3'-cyclic phosphodiesterase [Hellea sp.]
METYRLFAAIRPTEPVIEALTRLQKGVDGARWSGAEKLHVTLGFFGDVKGDQAELLDQELAKIRQSAFSLSLSGVGHFGRGKPHSIWAGVDDNLSLSQLHKAIKAAAERAGIILERRDYRPHVTLAYFGAHPDIARIAKFEARHHDFKTAPFMVDQFWLYSSWQRKRGSNLYKAEASYPLLGRKATSFPK